MDTEDPPPAYPETALQKATKDVNHLLNHKKEAVQKKLARRFALLLMGLGLIALGGGYFLWNHFFSSHEQESLGSSNQISYPASAHLPPVVTPRPMDLYAASFSEISTSSGTICLVLLRIGQFSDLTQDALEQLPPEITFAISPLYPQAKEWAEKSHLKKHEILVTLGLQPDNYPSNDPGPNTLLTDLPWEKNFQRFLWALEQVPMAVGVTHDTGNYFTTVEAAVRPIIQEVRRSGLFFLDTPLSPGSLIPKISREEYSPYAAAYYFCSENPFLVERDFRNLEFLAQKKGHVIAVAPLTPFVLKKLVEWTKDLKEKNIVLAPLTTLFKRNILKDYTRVNAQRPEL